MQSELDMTGRRKRRGETEDDEDDDDDEKEEEEEVEEEENLHDNEYGDSTASDYRGEYASAPP